MRRSRSLHPRPSEIPAAARPGAVVGVLAAALLSLAAPTAAGAAATSAAVRTLDVAGGTRLLRAADRTDRTCSARPAGAGTPGVVQERRTVATDGLLDARLLGSPLGDDWDLAVFDEATGGLLGGSAAFGGTEVVSAPVRAGRRVVVQACRRSGAVAVMPLTVVEVVPDGPLPAPATLSLVSIAVDGQTDVDRLQAAGLDLNETGEQGRIAAVLHSTDDADAIRRLGLSYTTEIADLAAHDRAAARTSARAAGTRSSLPGARSSYRTLLDYQNDLKALVAAHPGVVRRVVLPGTSVQGRAIEGVEIATDVDRTDDGRPTVYQLGLHHVREWPSGEVAIEHALDLLTPRDDTDRVRKQAILDGVRTFVLPVINPDGLVATQLAGTGTTAADDDENATLALAAAGSGAYRRKNCGDGLAQPQPTTPSTPCALLPGVDLNRNYGAFWGGPGTSDQPTSQTYRGARPFSEPEAEAFHRWSSTHVVNVVNSNHTFGGDLLYQPGFNKADEPGLPKNTKVPFQDRMKALSDAWAAAAGYRSFVSYNLYDVTGATEDWNYFATGAFGYTTEVAFENFHPNYQDGVVDQFLGTVDGAGATAAGRKPSNGLREAMLQQAEAALDPANHATIRGTAPAGQVLRLTKSFTTSTSFVESTTDGVGPAMQLPETLDVSRTVPADGAYTWAVGPSTRPVELLAGRTESWTMTCEDPDGTVRQTQDVVVGLGESRTVDFAGCAPPVTPPTTTTTTAPPTTAPAPATTTPTPAAPAGTTGPGGTTGPAAPGTTAGTASSARPRVSRPAFSAARARRTGVVGVRVRPARGTVLRRVLVRIVDRRGRTLFRAAAPRVAGARTLRLRRVVPSGAVRPGRVRVVVRATIGGRLRTVTRTVRVTP